MPTAVAQWMGPILLIASSIVAITLMIRLRVFRANGVVGPARLADPTLAGGLLLTAMIGFVTMIAATTIAVTILKVVAAAATQPATQPTTSPAATQPAIPSATTAYASIFSVLTAWLVSITMLRMLHPQSLQWLGMRLRDLESSLPGAAAAILIILPVTFCSMLLFQWLYSILHFPTENEHQLLKLLRESPQLLPVIVLSACVLAPLLEELIFRGCVQTAVVAVLGKSPIASRWIAILLSSALFALVHGEFWMMPPLFVLAVGLGYSYERTGKLWVPILTHAAFNTASIVVFLVATR